MPGIRREAVYTKLDPLPFRALESAFQLARTRGDAYVELAHWLNQILHAAGFRPAPHRAARSASTMRASPPT